MSRRLFLNFLAFMLLSMLASGCAVNRATATIDPSANLQNIKSLYVKKFEPDGRAVNVLIADKLKVMGYTVSTGDEVPDNVDAVVTYVDKWMWDLTMYMIELTVTIRDPKSDFPLASGNSYHTSLSRKSPEEMVDEVLANIFNKDSRP